MAPIISKIIRIRCPEHFEIADNSIVDDFCYFSTRVNVGMGCHIASGCTIAGGAARTFTMGSFSSLASGVKVYCVSNDFVNGLIAVSPLEDPEQIEGDVILGNYTGIGSNSVVMPDNVIPEGVAIGALSFVPCEYNFRPWSVYAGIPIHRIGPRNRKNVLRRVAEIQCRWGT